MSEETKETKTIKVKNSYVAKVMPVVVNGQMMSNPVAESLKKKKIPTLVQYWSRRALDKVAQLFKAYDETRMERVRQYGKKDEDGELLIVMKESAKIRPLILEAMDNKIYSQADDTPERKKELENLNLADALIKIELDADELTKAMENEGVSVKTAKAISKWSEGKISAESSGEIVTENMADLQKDINDLMEEEVDLGINLIKVDIEEWDKSFFINAKGEKVYRYDLITGEEMDLLWPMLDIE